jgi:hypothetical protein
MTWASEILSEGEWVGNGVVLATKEEAEDYGIEMLSRCILFKDAKVVPSEKPANYKWENGCLARLDK